MQDRACPRSLGHSGRTEEGRAALALNLALRFALTPSLRSDCSGQFHQHQPHSWSQAKRPACPEQCLPIGQGQNEKQFNCTQHLFIVPLSWSLFSDGFENQSWTLSTCWELYPSSFPSSLPSLLPLFKVSQGWCNKLPWTLCLKQQKFILSQLWRSEVQDQGISRATLPSWVLEENPFFASSNLWWLLLKVTKKWTRNLPKSYHPEITGEILLNILLVFSPTIY